MGPLCRPSATRNGPASTMIDPRFAICRHLHALVIIEVLSGSNSVVECDLAKVEVAGSTPVSRSRGFYPRPVRGFLAWPTRGARSPSGKAEVCKTSIGGSIPPRASKSCLKPVWLVGPSTRLRLAQDFACRLPSLRSSRLQIASSSNPPRASILTCATSARSPSTSNRKTARLPFPL